MPTSTAPHGPRAARGGDNRPGAMWVTPRWVGWAAGPRLQTRSLLTSHPPISHDPTHCRAQPPGTNSKLVASTWRPLRSVPSRSVPCPWRVQRLLPAGVDAPTSFETVGHIAHVNLRAEQLPHRQLIGAVLLDKNPQLRTIVNKVRPRPPLGFTIYRMQKRFFKLGKPSESAPASALPPRRGPLLLPSGSVETHLCQYSKWRSRRARTPDVRAVHEPKSLPCSWARSITSSASSAWR